MNIHFQLATMGLRRERRLPQLTQFRFVSTVRFLFLMLILFWAGAGLHAEGTHQVAPAPTDITMLLTNRDGFGNFAAFNGPVDSRLFFTIHQVGEVVRIGLSCEYSDAGAAFSDVQQSRYRFRIVRASDGVVVHGPYTVDRNTDNINSWNDAVYNVYSLTRTEGGQPVYVFSPATAGDYYIEIEDVPVVIPDGGTVNDSNGKDVIIGYWDIQVMQNSEANANPVNGRLWSRNWAFRTPRVTGASWPDCGWDREFRGTLYSYTTDGFVSKIDFNNSGFQGLSFNVAFNSRGPGNSGNLAQDRRSVPAQNLTANAAEHRIFLNEPCILCFPNGECGIVTGASKLTCDDGGAFCLPVTVTKPGQVEVVLDFNQNGKYDAGTEDVVLVYSFFGKDELSTCIPWNGLKGNGQPLEFGDKADLVYIYTQGVQHWSVYDVEFIKSGYCVQGVRPICGESVTDVLYWDDVNIPQDPGTGQPKDGQGGCSCQSGGCRTWTNFNPNPDAPSADCVYSEEEKTAGYGDKNTINTWWYASVTRVVTKDVLFLTCDIEGDDVICAGSTSTFTANVSSSTAGFTYKWSGPGGFNGTSASTGPISTPGEYCVTITDEEGCETSCCRTLTVNPNPIPSATSSSVKCAGGNSGSVTATASGGMPPYSFNLTGPGIDMTNTTGLFTGLPGGDYILTVTDQKECQGAIPVKVTVIPALTCTVKAEKKVSCQGGSDGVATVTPQGGTEPYAYEWDNGENTQQAVELSAGIHSVTVTDANQCTTTCLVTIEALPALSCSTVADKLVSCEGGEDGAATATAMGGTGPYSYVWDNGETTQQAVKLKAGTHSVMVTDANGCQTTCSVIMGTVRDETKPVLVCPANIIVNTASGTCGATVSFQATATDNCDPDVAISYSHNPGTVFPLGITTVTVTATDDAGNKSTCSFTVRVNDRQRPVVKCPANIVVNNDPGICGAKVDFKATATDNCDPDVTITYSRNPGTVFPVGTTTVTVTARDDSGNRATCSFTVKVNDKEAPVVTCPANIVVNNDPGICGAKVNFNATARDNCDTDVTLSYSQLSGTVFPVGVTTVTVTATDDAGNSSSCSFTVTVNDNEAPVVTCPDDIVMNTDPGICGAKVSFNAAAKDNCDTDVTLGYSHNPGTVFPVGTTTVTVTAIDDAGNSSGCSFTVTVNDKEAPVLSCPANIVVNNDPGICGAIVRFSASADDNCDSDVALSYSHSSGNVFPVGMTTVTVTATDDAGNSSSCSFTVTVNDKEAPVLSCPANIVVNNDPGICGAKVSFNATVKDNCDTDVTLSYSHSSGTVFPVGMTIVTVTATDDVGNSASCSFTVTVNDKEAPVLSCPANIAVNTDPGICGAKVSFKATATDNCDTDVTLSYSHLSGTVFPVGMTTVTVTATDDAGNSSSCSFTVTVNDKEPPMLSCPANLIVDAEKDLCGATVTFGAEVSDNCDTELSLTYEPASGSFFPIGTTIVTVTARDDAGNTAICTFTVEIRDVQMPSIIFCPEDLELGCDESTDPGETGFPSAIDNCTGQVPQISYTDEVGVGSCPEEKVITRTWQVKDAAGNTTTCVQKITLRNESPLCQITPYTPPQLPVCLLPYTVPDLVALGLVKVTDDGCSPVTVTQSPLAGSTVTMPEGGLVISITVSDGCTSSTCLVTVPCRAAQLCTFTIGYWSNHNDDPRKDPDVVGMLALLPDKVIPIGPWKLDAACIDILLPGQPHDNKQPELNNLCGLGIKLKENNIMVQQTIGLTLNILYSPGLQHMPLSELVSRCRLIIPKGLPAGATVGDLLKLANSRIPSFDATINEALTLINQCFDDCSVTSNLEEDQALIPATYAGELTVTVAPNPALAELQVLYNVEDEGMGTLTVFNLQGVIVREMKIEYFAGKNIARIDLNALPAGGYFLLLRANDKTGRVKFIVER